ncbi:hypothetical protein SKAU_G00324760 [Synaphobranchus kaupii]|uniref:Uncharacterized protein n=1 Tax=Synaphobranchus kaupii TaxID=118154 RepID=A0A9Q1EPE3_SYNKA|nr:hypothetical protein SKAU_G00324760 [Synaphobranchus kaupii]
MQAEILRLSLDDGLERLILMVAPRNSSDVWRTVPGRSLVIRDAPGRRQASRSGSLTRTPPAMKAGFAEQEEGSLSKE